MDTSAPSLILIVDDETKIRRIVASNLERAGYDVISAADGMHALEIFELQSPKPALVLMDVMMPEMDGFEATRLIRQQARWRKLPIIAVTAKAMKDDQQRCLQAGANDYLAKPIDLDRLFSLIRVWLPQLERI